MLQFHYQQGCIGKLDLFSHILEIGARKNTAIKLQSFPERTADGMCIYFINEGRFEWKVDGKLHLLYPGDIALILPQQQFGNEKGILELGTIHWVHLKFQRLKNEEWIPGNWTGMTEQESAAIGKLLCLNNKPILSKQSEVGKLLQTICLEIHNHELGYVTRTNHLLDELLIIITRQLTRQQNPSRDFSKMFLQLEEALRKDLSHQWSVEEMAAIAGMGTTLFNEKVKNYTGFTPINYLINIRISEAIKLLKRKGVSITDIALDTGFYSSQHFSTTFKKLTGYTPSEFRKNNASAD
jgi:AraC-like DNA-binding protein